MGAVFVQLFEHSAYEHLELGAGDPEPEEKALLELLGLDASVFEDGSDDLLDALLAQTPARLAWLVLLQASYNGVRGRWGAKAPWLV